MLRGADDLGLPGVDQCERIRGGWPKSTLAQGAMALLDAISYNGGLRSDFMGPAAKCLSSAPVQV